LTKLGLGDILAASLTHIWIG